MVDRVAEVSRPTHNTALAIAGAAAVAAAVSAGVAGRTIAEAVERAMAAATLVERDQAGTPPGAGPCAVADRIRSAVDRVSGCGIRPRWTG